MIEATKYLRWNGVCAVDPVAHPGACNDNPGGPRPTEPPERELSVHASVDVEEGVTAELMRFEVNLLEVTPVTTATAEYVSIKARFKAIDLLASMVVQIYDKVGRLVYAERLAAAKVWGLPDVFDDAAVPAPWVANDQETKATLDHAPYTVSLLVTREDGPIALDLGEPPDDSILRNPIPVSLVGARPDQVRVRTLEILQCDPHFAPSRTAAEEALSIAYETSGIGGQAVTLEIWSDHYQGGAIIYQAAVADTSDGAHVLRWNGEANCGAGDLAGNRLIHPLCSPYRVHMRCDPLHLLSSEKVVKVLYHSIALGPGTYVEDPANPPAQGATEAYVQHKLNELGYFAGPQDGTLNPQTRRALRRYTFTQANFPETENIHTTVIQSPIHPTPTLIDALAAGVGAKTLFEHADCISNGVDSKIYLDHNTFYIQWAQFSQDTGHSATDLRVLDRFEVPIEATIYLVSRFDMMLSPDNRVAAGEAAGPVTVEWTVIDPPEDTALAPTAAAGSPSRTRAYLVKTATATAGAAGHGTNPQDNCPGAPNRGVRGAADHFRTGDVLLPYRGTAAGGAGVRSTVFVDPANPRKVGKTGVLFRGSYIAGDNFIVQANLTLADRGGRQNALETDHQGYFGVPAFGGIANLQRRTGKMTLWRRHAIAATIDWPAPSPNQIAWDAVKRQYALAHIELDTSAIAATDMTTLMATKGVGLAQNQTMFQFAADGHADHLATQGAAYQADQVYCGPAIPAQGDAEQGSDYEDRVVALLEAYLTSDYLCDVATFIRNTLLLEERAGQVTMRVNWHRPIRVLQRAKVFGSIVPHLGIPKEFRPQIFCIGLAAGVTMLQNDMLAFYDDGFLVAHEIGHCMYLNHHETDRAKAASDTPTHHDQADHNCMMSYPFGIASRNPPAAPQALSWAKGSPSVPHFCGKCTLKLRGWDIVGVGLPDNSL